MTQNETTSRTREPFQLRAIRSTLNTIGKLSPYAAGWLALQLFFTPIMQPKTTRGQIILDQAEQVQIPHRGGYLRGYTWGHGEQTVLLVHGWRASSGSMSAFVLPLVDARFRVVAFDLPAHAHSPGTQTDMLDSNRAVKTAIRQFPPVHGVIAHSFGASAAAIALADLQPESVARVAFIAANHSAEVALHGFAKQFNIRPATLRSMYHHFERRSGYPVEEFSLERTVPLIPSRGLIVHDRNDDNIPFESAERLVRAWPSSSYHFTEGLGHNNLLRHEDTVRWIVNFISKA